MNADTDPYFRTTDIFNREWTRMDANIGLDFFNHLWTLMSTDFGGLLKNFARPSLRSESAAAALSGATRRPTRRAACAAFAAQFFISHLRVFAFICG